MTRQLIPHTLPISGETIMIVPVSLSAETMLTRRQYPAPKPPAVTVTIDGKKQTERNAADPDFIKAYRIYENELQIEVTDRILRQIALKQSLNDEQRAEVEEIRDAVGDIEQLPKSDKIVWLFKCAIASDNDIKSILSKSAELADPQEDRIGLETDGF